MKTTIPGPLDRKTNTLLIWWRVWVETAAIPLLEVLPRGFDILLSLVLIVVFSPALVLRAMLAKSKLGKVFVTLQLIGRFRMRYYSTSCEAIWHSPALGP